MSDARAIDKVTSCPYVGCGLRNTRKVLISGVISSARHCDVRTLINFPLTTVPSLDERAWLVRKPLDADGPYLIATDLNVIEGPITGAVQEWGSPAT